jgi:hypothetical protein
MPVSRKRPRDRNQDCIGGDSSSQPIQGTVYSNVQNYTP